jgi:hypothetical protein
MFCYTIELKYFSLEFNRFTALNFNVVKKTISEILEIYNDLLSDALLDKDLLVISTSLQESPKD